MTQKQLVAYGIIACLVGAVITGMVEPYNAEAWYLIEGLGLFVFGIWASVLLLKK